MREINIAKNPRKFLEKLQYSDKAIAFLITKKIAQLPEDPLPSNYKKLVGYEKLYRVRVDKYRIIYRFDSEMVYIMHISKREDVYDFLLK